MIHLDTHVVVWLYAGRTDLLPEPVGQHLAKEDLAISPAVLLELELLLETGRITEGGRPIVDDLAQRIGLRVSGASFQQVAIEAARQKWTRDPFDRLVVGQAAVEAVPLASKDRKIRQHYPLALWA